jgi:hypothetical protein
LHGHSGPQGQSALLSSRGCGVEQGFLPGTCARYGHVPNR